ncbi:MAG: hypothetical protein F6K36_07275 [Symploca sp. SIO3C6]|uniref:Uncharacterized protein n=1 Tax=Symploca sp. SIO1C4 TaxID=2607765 RepID=A0A6B3NHT1_9CYAN|nr:hypothetical protein [Symploca sp. SIO3C6]NER30102.1 hypothetical protein [Symploca sp. SIO1C4]NET04021.1 hypothetical protein [Symploca sp. SIO2B6]
MGGGGDGEKLFFWADFYPRIQKNILHASENYYSLSSTEFVLTLFAYLE